jgi:hypothetical protein
MSRILRRRPSPGTVIGFLALFVAMSGVSYGLAGTNTVTSNDIVRNAVGRSEIRTNGVRSAEIRRNAVGRSEIRSDAVGPSEVRDDTDSGGGLTGLQINESTLGEVPSATNADTAANANNLGGVPPSGYLRSTNQGGGALAGVNVSAAGTVLSFFNRFGGVPTIAHTAGSGLYTITFPGLEGELANTQVIHLATLGSSATTGQIVTTSSGSNPRVRTFNAADALTDRSFSYTAYGTNQAPTP